MLQRLHILGNHRAFLPAIGGGLQNLVASKKTRTDPELQISRSSQPHLQSDHLSMALGEHDQMTGGWNLPLR